jgi:hypothetical protein
MNRDDVDTFEKLKGQLDGLHQEISVLARKSPNDAVNKFKLKFVNATIYACNSFFGIKYKPFQEFDCFSEDDIPSNSDVSFMISQYIECAEKYRADNITQIAGGHWRWVVSDENEKIRTSPPIKITNR